MNACRTLGLIAVAVVISGAAVAMERGEYLAKIANCEGCHTATSGQAMAGGKALTSPFGRFVTPNITADPGSGIGNWTADDLHRALHEGLRPDGASLYPACPFPSYTLFSRDDSEAIYHWLRSLPAVSTNHEPHQLDLPYRFRWLLKPWRWLNFRPATRQNNAEKSPARNQGHWLVEGPGHCNECHGERDALGAKKTNIDTNGSVVRGWHADSLASGAGVQQWSQAEVVELLQSGRNKHASTMGPMAQVVFNSLQYLSSDDANAMAEYLRSLPVQMAEPKVPLIRLPAEEQPKQQTLGKQVFAKHCADCHGQQGQGSAAAIALAGNRAVQSPTPINLIQIVKMGGYPPGTKHNPRPFGMPPFQSILSNDETAAVISYIRRSWGNTATPISTIDVDRYFQR